MIESDDFKAPAVIAVLAAHERWFSILIRFADHIVECVYFIWFVFYRVLNPILSQQELIQITLFTNYIGYRRSGCRRNTSYNLHAYYLCTQRELSKLCNSNRVECAYTYATM